MSGAADQRRQRVQVTAREDRCRWGCAGVLTRIMRVRGDDQRPDGRPSPAGSPGSASEARTDPPAGQLDGRARRSRRPARTRSPRRPGRTQRGHGGEDGLGGAGGDGDLVLRVVAGAVEPLRPGRRWPRAGQGTPAMGAYWLAPARMWWDTRSTSSGRREKSGKPCERLMAPHSAASRDMTVKMVVPTSGRRLSTGKGSRGIPRIYAIRPSGAAAERARPPARR